MNWEDELEQRILDGIYKIDSDKLKQRLERNIYSVDRLNKLESIEAMKMLEKMLSIREIELIMLSSIELKEAKNDV